MGYVPALVDGTTVVSDSYAILLVSHLCFIFFMKIVTKNVAKVSLTLSFTVSGRKIPTTSFVATRSNTKIDKLSGKWAYISFTHLTFIKFISSQLLLVCGRLQVSFLPAFNLFRI